MSKLCSHYTPASHIHHVAILLPQCSSSGILYSMEPAIMEHQEAARDEAAAFPEVAFAQDPVYGYDWLGYFKNTFVLAPGFEIWEGAQFLKNVDVRPSRMRRGWESIPVWSLHKTSLICFDTVMRAVEARAGVVVVFRSGPPDAEPFGVWFSWIRIGSHIVVVDLQNSAAHGTLTEAVTSLMWPETAKQEEVFYAPMRCGVATGSAD